MELSKKTRLYVSLSVVAAIFIVAVSIIGHGVYRVVFDPASFFEQDFAAAVDQHFGERTINVALLGLDDGGYRPEEDRVHRVDTLMVASLNFDRDTVSLVSIPRDARVEIAYTGLVDKISRAYLYGYSRDGRSSHQAGLRYTIDTLSLALEGANLHYYVALDMEALIMLVDAMGGVEYDVDLNIVGDDVLEELYIGPQQLTGKGYLTYLSYSEPAAEDDLPRIMRQKKLLLATFNYFKQTGRFHSILPTYRVYRDYVYTDLSIQQITALTFYAGEQLEEDSINAYSLRGEYRELAGDGYLIIDEEARSELLKEVFILE